MGKRAGIASGEARRAKREELKARFIAAIEAGAELTKTGVVAPRTYQVWIKDDPDFATKVDKVIQSRKTRFIASGANMGKVSIGTYRVWRRDDPEFAAKVDAIPRQKSRKPKPKRRTSVLDGLTEVDVYVKAVKLLGNRKLMADIREAAISELIIMMLSGEEPNASKAVNIARDEFLPHARYLEGDECNV